MKSPFTSGIRHIAVAAPAGPPCSEKIKKSSSLLRSLGLKVTVMPNVFRGADEKYLSADIESRVSDIHACWRDETVDLLLCARGGYGSAQLLPHLDWKLLKSRKLPVLGYSDITALHLAMCANDVGIPVAAPMADKFDEVLNDEYTVKSIFSALSGEAAVVFEAPPKFKIKVIKSAELSAPVIPANLTILVSLLGTPYFPNLGGKILLIEDIGEKVRQLDRALTQLRLAGVLEDCSGLIFGGFSKCGRRRERDAVFSKFTSYVNGPVLSGFPFGHFLPMKALRWNTTFKIENSGRITMTPAEFFS
ncbi:MAG: hypothetical protein A2017_11165 [Lentisphaerae bacterium GWF2_44_16]|nr:MAG: hypothetical protein A2017_11165 [Lentisphaerae bacterium GWF2_44_16]